MRRNLTEKQRSIVTALTKGPAIHSVGGRGNHTDLWTLPDGRVLRNRDFVSLLGRFIIYRRDEADKLVMELTEKGWAAQVPAPAAANEL